MTSETLLQLKPLLLLDEPAHEISVLTACAQIPLISAHIDVPSEPRILIFGLSLHLHPYFMSASRCADLPEPTLLGDAIST